MRLLWLLNLLSPLGTQPQGDVGGLHRLPYHPYQVIAQGLKVCFVAQLSRECFQGLSGVVLLPAEASIDEALDAPPQGGEQRRYQEGAFYQAESSESVSVFSTFSKPKQRRH